jgi:sugar O-acyltransferase (sialic acid O-acetyltransferase NeuD family)
MMRTPIVIVGAGGHGRETALLIEQINDVHPQYDLQGFLDDDEARADTVVGGYPVLGPVRTLATLPANVQVAIGVGAPRLKRHLDTTWLSARTLPTLVHPSVIMGSRIAIGDGSQLHAGVILSTDIRIGRAVTINRRVDVSHDDTLGDFVTLAPSVSLAGNVWIDDEVDVGINATCIPGVRLGARCVVGAGAVVIDDVPAGMTVVGVPARPVRSASSDVGTLP